MESLFTCNVLESKGSIAIAGAESSERSLRTEVCHVHLVSYGGAGGGITLVE